MRDPSEVSYTSVFLCHSQSLAARLVLYYQDSQTRKHMFPPTNSTTSEAIELGPFTISDGPKIAIIKGITSSPEAITEWIRDTFFSHTIGRAFYVLPTPVDSKEELLEKVKEYQPPAGSLIRLQCQPRSLEEWLVTRIEDDYTKRNLKCDFIAFTHMIHVVEIEGKYHYGFHKANVFFRHLPDGPKRVDGQISKAAGKLAEALQASGVPLSGSIAIDLGAAPGGWTKLLALKGLSKVLAIDPGALDQEVLDLPNVVHIRAKAQTALAEASKVLDGKLADLLVCDMNIASNRICEVAREWFPLLKSGGLLILTMKFYGKGRDRTRFKKLMDEELEGCGFTGGCKMVWLLANTNKERTLFAIKD